MKALATAASKTLSKAAKWCCRRKAFMNHPFNAAPPEESATTCCPETRSTSLAIGPSGPHAVDAGAIGSADQTGQPVTISASLSQARHALIFLWDPWSSALRTQPFAGILRAGRGPEQRHHSPQLRQVEEYTLPCRT